MRHERLAIVFSNVAVGDDAGFGSQITRELAAVVILDDDDFLLFETIAVIASQWRGTIHLIWRLLAATPSSFANFCMASRMTPSVEPQPTKVTCASSGPTSRGLQERQNRFHLAHALFMHGLALVGVGVFVADQHAILVMFIGRHDMRVSRCPWQRPGRDTVIRELITIIAAIDGR